MSSITPWHGSSEIDDAEEIGGAVIVAGGDGSELLESREKVFDQMLGSVEVLIVFPWSCSVGF